MPGHNCHVLYDFPYLERGPDFFEAFAGQVIPTTRNDQDCSFACVTIERSLPGNQCFIQLWASDVPLARTF
jgi:hypothetical protein